MRGLGFHMIEDLQNQSVKTGEKKPYCAVDRGILASRLPDQWINIKNLADKPSTTTEDLTNYVKALKDSGDFSGVLHTITFKVSGCIKLAGVGFFGPHEAEVAEYTVSAKIETAVKGFHKIMSQTLHGVPAEKGKICEVFFHNPVLIEANRFYNILFELDGPKTGICDPKTLQTLVEIKPPKGPEVCFEFLQGSLQLPRLLFEVM